MKVVKGTAAPLRQIILAIDGSTESAKAVAFVLSKFQPHRLIDKGRRVTVRVSVVHVMARRRLAPLTIRMTVPWIKSEKKVKDAAHRLVEQIVQELIEAGFAPEPICRLGDPAQEIMKVASNHHADLIVMGAKGLGTIDRILLGSVSTRVMHYGNCPVLVVR